MHSVKLLILNIFEHTKCMYVIILSPDIVKCLYNELITL